MDQQKKDVYIGYVGDRKEFDSGVVKYSISFKEAQLDEMKKYLTGAGNVNVDFIIKTDGTAFTSVFNPRANGTKYSNSQANQTVAQGSSDLPF
jgi:hypothetical protein